MNAETLALPDSPLRHPEGAYASLTRMKPMTLRALHFKTRLEIDARARWGLGGALVALAALLWWLIAATPPVAPAMPHLPPDLDAYLANAEARVPGLNPDAAKRITWHDPASPARTPLAVVFLHGFSATRHELSPLPERLAERLGANLFSTRLTGHGLPGAALGEARPEEWTRDAVEALTIGRRLGERVVLIGNSTGATLATWLAARYPEQVAAVVALSPNFGLANPAAELLGWPGARAYVPLLVGDQRSWTPFNAEQARHWTTSYPSQAMVSMMELVRAVRADRLEAARAPYLMIYSPRDEIIDADAALKAFGRIGSPRKTAWGMPFDEDPQHHILAGDIISPMATDIVLGRVLQFLGGAR